MEKCTYKPLTHQCHHFVIIYQISQSCFLVAFHFFQFIFCEEVIKIYSDKPLQCLEVGFAATVLLQEHNKYIDINLNHTKFIFSEEVFITRQWLVVATLYGDYRPAN